MAGLYSFYTRYNHVRQIPIFSTLSWFELQKIARVANIVEFRKGECVCKQGNPSDAFYCLISGRVQSYKTNTSNDKYDVAFLHRGMFFGIISLLTGETHSSSYEALNDSVVLKIDKHDFQKLLKSISNLGLELSHSLSRRIRSHALPTKATLESHIISVYAPVKDTGSSTYAVNLAMGLKRETDKKVILVHIVSSAEPASFSGPTATLGWKKPAVVLGEIIDDHEGIMRNVVREQLDVDFIHVSFDPHDSSLINRMSQFVTAFVNDYHYIVVDLPNEMHDFVLKTLVQSDTVQLITTNKEEDLKLTRHAIDELHEKTKENFHPEKVQVLISVKEEGTISLQEISKEIEFEIALQLPYFQLEELGKPIVAADVVVTLPRSSSAYAQAVRKMARKISGVLVGLVLGGGAALGVAHVGVLKVLEEENIPIDVVVGSSMGALMGAFWATGKTIPELESLAREFRSKKSLWKLVDLVLPISGFVGGRMISRWLRTRGLEDKTFYDTRVPLKIVAYDLVKRQELILDSGSILDAVRKSISIPGVIVPVQEQDKVIIDGGVLNPLPTNVLVKMGIKKIIAINVLQSPEDVTKGFLEEQARQKEEEHVSFAKAPWRFVRFRMFKLFLKLFTPAISDIIVQSLQASEYVIAQQSAQYADIVIHPDTSGMRWYELYKVEELLRRGEEATREALPQIKALVKK